MSEPIENILHDLEGLHKQSTQGEWCKGLTSHHTIRKEDNYPIATFKHADDASFVDFAHKFVPDLIAEVRRLQVKVVQPLRKLSEDEVKDLPFSISCTHIYYNEAVPDEHSCLDWANAIMDKMIEVNK